MHLMDMFDESTLRSNRGVLMLMLLRALLLLRLVLAGLGGVLLTILLEMPQITTKLRHSMSSPTEFNAMQRLLSLGKRLCSGYHDHKNKDTAATTPSSNHLKTKQQQPTQKRKI